MVSTIFQPPVGPGVSERVRWIEQNYATQRNQKATRHKGEDPSNGGLMGCDGGGWARDGARAVERCGPGGGPFESRKRRRAGRSVQYVVPGRAMGDRRVAGCKGVEW